MAKYRGKDAARRREKARRQRRDKPEYAKAHAAVAAALRQGDLVRGTDCCSCGEIKPTVAHHWSYEEEHWLDVVWICRRCHTKHT